MSLPIQCPSCRAKLTAPDLALGQAFPCPQCARPVLVSAPELPSNLSATPSAVPANDDWSDGVASEQTGRAVGTPDDRKNALDKPFLNRTAAPSIKLIPNTSWWLWAPLTMAVMVFFGIVLNRPKGGVPVTPSEMVAVPEALCIGVVVGVGAWIGYMLLEIVVYYTMRSIHKSEIFQFYMGRLRYSLAPTLLLVVLMLFLSPWVVAGRGSQAVEEQTGLGMTEAHSLKKVKTVAVGSKGQTAQARTEQISPTTQGDPIAPLPPVVTLGWYAALLVVGIVLGVLIPWQRSRSILVFVCAATALSLLVTAISAPLPIFDHAHEEFARRGETNLVVTYTTVVDLSLYLLTAVCVSSMLELLLGIVSARSGPDTFLRKLSAGASSTWLQWLGHA